jgi:hypothetical protein
VQLSWPETYAEARLEDGRIRIEVDCGELRRQRTEEALQFTSFQAEAVEPAAGWAEWSVESDELEENLDRTLQLRHFVAGTRPESFDVEVHQSLLGGQS